MKLTPLTILIIILALIGTTYYCAAADDQVLEFSYEFKICPNLSAMKFHLSWDEKANGFGIEVYDKVTGKLIQKLTVEDIEKPYQGPGVFATEDINFDGCQDLKLLSFTGGTGNEIYSYCLFDPKTNTFHFAEELSDQYICDPILIKEKKEIFSHCNAGGAGVFYNESTYKYLDNKLTLIREETQSDDPFKRVIIYEQKELRDGKLITVDYELMKYDDGEFLKKIEKRIQNQNTKGTANKTLR